MHALALIAILAAQEPPAVEPWSLVSMDLELRVAPPALTMRGRAVVRLDAAQSRGPVFGINSRKRVMRLTELHSGATKATIGPFKDAIDVAVLKFDRTFKRGDTLTVDFTAESGEESSQFAVWPEAAFGSWVESWYPVPGVSLTELASPAAPGRTTLRVPRGWRSVSNGRLTDSRIDGDELVETWTSTVPVARSFVAAPFVVAETTSHGGLDIGLYMTKPRPDVAAQAATLARALAAMEQRLGPYPYPTYNIVELPEKLSFAAASEQGLIMVRASLLDAKEGNLPLFAHEAGHGWFGNLVRTRGPGSQMISESLAQYGAVMAIETIEGEAAMREFLRFSRKGYSPTQCALGYFYVWRQGGDKPLAQLSGARWDHTLADAKGHWFYRMLRLRMGDEAFFGALRTYLKRFAGSQATLDEIREIFLAARPDDSGLRAFLAQWLDRTGAPILRVDWWSSDRGRAVEVTVTQLQEGEPFQFPLELAIETAGGGMTTTTVDICDREQRFFLPTTARPTAVRLDPNDRVLVWHPEYGEPPY